MDSTEQAQFDEMQKRLSAAHAQLNNWPVDPDTSKKLTQEDVDRFWAVWHELYSRLNRFEDRLESYGGDLS